MSQPIPSWLSHLRTDRRGLPVPYVNQWGVEDLTRCRIEYDPNVRRDALFCDDSAELVPDFTRQNMQRQRAATVQGLCQVCGWRVPAGPRTVAIGEDAARATVGGVEVLMVGEPWLCRRCALFARDRCPSLIRRGEGEQLRLLSVLPGGWQLSVSEGVVDGPFAVQTAASPVALWVKILLPLG